MERGFISVKNVGLILGFLIMLLFQLLPVPDGMKPEAFRLAGVALLMAIWWMTEAIPITVTALLPLVLFPLLNILSVKTAATQFGNHIVFLFLGGFMIATAMEKWNLHRRIALKVLLVVGFGPKRILMGVMIATAGISMWISNTATAMMMFPIVTAVVIQIAANSGSGEKVERALGRVMMLGLAYSASIGGVATLIGTPPNIVLTGFMEKLYPQAPPISFLQWMLFGLPFAIIMIPLAWLVILRVAGKELTKLTLQDGGKSVVRQELAKMGSLSRPERRVLILFLLTVFGLVFRAPIRLGVFAIPGWSQLLPAPSFVLDSTVLMLMGVMLFILPSGAAADTASTTPGGNLLRWREFEKRAPWGILLLFGGGFALAKAFVDTGLAAYIGDGMHVLAGAPVLLSVLVVCLLMTFLTEVTSNTATTTTMMPIVGAVAVGMGINPMILMIPAAVSASCAFMLPVATPPNAIIFGSHWVTIPDMSRTGLILNLTGALVITLLLWLLGPAVFDIQFSGLPIWLQ